MNDCTRRQMGEKLVMPKTPRDKGADYPSHKDLWPESSGHNTKKRGSSGE